MLEQLLIFTRGGLILWTCRELGNALKGSPIDTLIRSCLLEERSGASSFNYDAPGAAYTLKWTFHNELGLVFVAVYQRILHLLYVDDLLAKVKQEFSQIYDPKKTLYNDFDDVFQQLKMEAEARAEELRKSKQVSKPVSANLSKKQGAGQKSGFDGGNKKKSSDDENGAGDGNKSRIHEHHNGHSNSIHIGNGEVNAVSPINGKENEGSINGAFNKDKLLKMQKGKGGKKTETTNTKASKAEPKKKATKKNRVWDDSPQESKLDFTDPVTENGDHNVVDVAKDHGESKMDVDEVISSESEGEEEEQGQDTGVEPKKKGWFSSMFTR